ncbi:MAG: hypothetical protein KGM24_05550 [Elusimicrobia bacterium]|nr:hypothetical protein [Elusimicrobiota bacterium]
MRLRNPLTLAVLSAALCAASAAAGDPARDSGASATLQDAASHLSAGDVSGIYGERPVGDPGAVGTGAPGGLRAAANAPGAAGLPENQLPQGFQSFAAAPPGVSGGAAAGSGSWLSRLESMASGLFRMTPATPPAKPMPDPSFSWCAPGQKAPCPVMNIDFSDGAEPVTEFVDYKKVDGRVFSSSSWWKFWDQTRRVSSSDVAQGRAGDCFLLASLAAVAATHPDVLLGMIKQDRTTSSFWVRFYEGKPLKPALVGPITDAFPVWKSDLSEYNLSGPVFAHPSSPDGPIWPLVVEKAYTAKFRHDSYASLNTGGDAGVAISRVTGRPTLSYSFYPGGTAFKTATLRQVAAWVRKGFPMTVATRQPQRCPGHHLTLGLTIRATDPERAAEPASRESDDAQVPYCDDPFYQGLVACAFRSGDPVCAQTSVPRLVPRHSYWIKSVDAAGGTVTLANPWGPGANVVTEPWSRLRRSLGWIFVNQLGGGR